MSCRSAVSRRLRRRALLRAVARKRSVPVTGLRIAPGLLRAIALTGLMAGARGGRSQQQADDAEERNEQYSHTTSNHVLLPVLVSATLPPTLASRRRVIAPGGSDHAVPE